MILLSQLKNLRTKAALDSLVDLRFGGDPTRFVDALNAGLNHLLRTDLQKAGRFVEQATGCFAFLPRRFERQLLAMQGRYNHWSGNYESALRHYQQALDICRRCRENEAMARLGRGLMDVHMYLGNYQEALEIGQRSLRFFRRKRRHIDAAQVMTNIGNVYHRMDNNRMALRYYDRAKEAFRKSGGTALAIVQYNRANIYANMNQLKKARSLYETSAGLYRQAGMEIAEAQARYSLAYLYFLEDKYTRAIEVFEKVYDRFSSLGDAKSAAVTKLDLVEINIHLNQYGSAIMLGEEIIGQFKALGMTYERAKAHYFVAWARMQLGDLKPASAELQKARVLFSREKNILWLGMVSIARSKLHAGTRQFSRAAEASREALAHFTKSGDERRKIDAEIAYADAVATRGRFKEASTLARRILRKKPTNSQRYYLYHLMGRCLYEQGDYQEALKLFRSAVSATERMLSGLYPDEIRFFFLLDKYEAYRMVVDCLLKLRRVNEAFLSNLRALATINQRSPGQRAVQREVPQRLLDSRDNLRATLKKLNQLPGYPSVPARAGLSYYSVEQKLWANERRIRSYRYPAQQRSRKAHPALEDIRPFIGADETVVNFVTTNGAVGAFYASGTTTEYRALDVSPNELNMMLRKLHFLSEKTVLSASQADNSRQAMDFYLNDVYRALFEPLAGHLGEDSLIIVADGMFGQIPFAALRSQEGRALHLQYNLRIVANPDDLALGRASSVRVGDTRNAIFGVSSEMLPSVETEAETIKEIFERSHLYTRQQANLQNLSKELQTADGFIHIAAHASRSSENPLFSRILMSDGPFFPFDLFGCGLKAKLVTLSGCQTAAPGLYYGNSFSLAKAFYQAGSRYVLASLWPVSDKLSTMFMIEFYEALHDGGDLFASYDRAVDQIKKIVDHPAFWGSFVLLGL